MILVAGRKKLYFEEQNITFRKNFILCKSCFWCASLFDDRRSTGICTSCMKAELESMPISLQTYRFYYDGNRAVTLEFGAIK
jgi:hypothetical protein